MKFLVIGLGSIGMRHAKNLMAMGHEVYGTDVDSKKLNETEKFGIKPAPSSVLVKFLPPGATKRLDGILICSPTAMHPYHIECAGNFLYPKIFVEKPIASKLDDKILAVLKMTPVAMVGNMLRFHPNVMMAKSLIKNPKSALFQVLQKNDKPAYRRDGVLLNWGAHEIDLALYLLGPAEFIGGKVQEDYARVNMQHKSGTISTVEMDYLTEPEVRKFKIQEEDESLHEVDLTLHDWSNIYIEEMKAFIGLIEGKPDPRCARGEDGLATLKLIEKAKEIAHDKG